MAPGAELTVSDTGCLRTDGSAGVAVITAAVDSQWADTTDTATDGSWSIVREAPAELGTYEYALTCDRYTERFRYANVTWTVTADGKPVRWPPAR